MVSGHVSTVPMFSPELTDRQGHRKNRVLVEQAGYDSAFSGLRALFFMPLPDTYDA
jgi:hypothetical protein